MANNTETKVAKDAPEKNIIFVGEGEPTTAINGIFKAELPDAATQKAGFYHPKAKEIIGHFPKKYKRFKKLGE